MSLPHICECRICGRAMESQLLPAPEVGTAVMNNATCPKCHQPMLSIPRMGLYHVCPAEQHTGDGG